MLPSSLVVSLFSVQVEVTGDAPLPGDTAGSVLYSLFWIMGAWPILPPQFCGSGGGV